MESLDRLDMASVRRLYRSRSLSPAELVAELLDRIERSSSANIWIHVAARDELLRRARELDSRGPGGLTLFGIPFAVKDNIDVAGMPTTAACEGYAYVPPASATSVRKLEEAGALCLGKANLDQFATGLSGVRSPYGPCSAVGNAAYISGGSSSGSALAVAAGLASFALGTDTGGSGRIPAGFNGVVGVKPTRGLISLAGVVPNCRTLDCVSIFALSVEDGHEVLRVAASPDRADPFSRLDQCAEDLDWTRVPSDFSFGVLADSDLEFGGDPAGADLYQQAVRRFERLGGQTVEVDFAPFREAGGLMFGGPFVAERFAGLRPFIDAGGLDLMLPVTRSIIGASQRWTAHEAFEALYRLASLRRMIAEVLKPLAFLVTPTAPRPFTHEELASDPIGANNALGHYSYCVNLLDLTAVALPTGTHPSGVSSGVTVVAPALQDGSLCGFAAAFLAEGLSPVATM